MIILVSWGSTCIIKRKEQKNSLFKSLEIKKRIIDTKEKHGLTLIDINNRKCNKKGHFLLINSLSSNQMVSNESGSLPVNDLWHSHGNFSFIVIQLSNGVVNDM